MSRSTHHGRTPRTVKLARMMAMALILALVAGILVLRFSCQSERQDEHIQEGLILLDEGMRTRSLEDIKTARSHFMNATKMNFLDTYPAFLVTATEEIEAVMSNVPKPDDPLLDPITAITDGRYEEAREQLLDASSKNEPLRTRASYYLRLVADLQQL